MANIIDTLITDRTKADINRLYQLAAKGQSMTPAEKIEYRNSKGGYKHSDWNRVESAVQYLAERLHDTPDELQDHAALIGVAWDILFDLPYDRDDYNPVTKTDWTIEDIPTITEMNGRYLANVKLLITALTAAYPTLPNSMNSLNYTRANAIEQALVLLHRALLAEAERITALIDKTAASFVYSGQPDSGMIWEEFTV